MLTNLFIVIACAIMGLIIAAMLAVLGFILFVVGPSMVLGEHDYAYRCREFGIVEKAGRTFGVRYEQWEPVGSDSVSVLCDAD